MSDLSTREQIRAAAIERLARWQHQLTRAKEPDCVVPPWAEDSEERREAHRAAVSGYVDALGDLLPTGVEWGVRYEAADITPRMDNPGGISTHTRTLPNEAHARAAVANGAPIRVTNRRAVSRYAHDWTEEDA